MKRWILAVAFTTLAVVLLVEVALAGDPDEFQKNVKELSKRLSAARKAFIAATKRFNELRGALERMQPNDPDYRPTAIEHNKVLAERRKFEQVLNRSKNSLSNEIRSFLQDNNKEVVETVFKVFYKGSSYPDIAVEQELLEALRKITNTAALDFMSNELKTSKRKNLRKLTCEVIANRTEGRFVSALVSALSDRDWEIVVAAARALSKNRSKAAVEPMISAYEKAEEKNDEGAIRGLRQALQDMTGEYVLETAQDFRNWWNGKGRESYNENETARPRGLVDSGGPRTSLLYGEIKSKKVVFVCDVSHSMSARGRVPGTPVDKSREPGDNTPETGGDLTGKKGRDKDKRRGLGGQGVKPGYVGMRIDVLKIELAHVVISLLPEQVHLDQKGGTLRLGEYACHLRAGTQAFRVYDEPVVHERHRHRFEFNNEYRQALEEKGLIASGLSPDSRLVEIVELKSHRWMVACQFHAEFKSRPNRPHPLFLGFIDAAKDTLVDGTQVTMQFQD